MRRPRSGFIDSALPSFGAGASVHPGASVVRPNQSRTGRPPARHGYQHRDGNPRVSSWHGTTQTRRLSHQAMRTKVPSRRAQAQ